MRKWVSFAVTLGLMASVPTSAQGCLDRATRNAARLNEFSTLMMAVNLRCKAIGIDISEGYGAMLEVHRPALAAADRRLRAFFSDQPRSYDAYATRNGNRYGGGTTDPAKCRQFDKVANDLAGQPDAAALGRVVFAMISVSHIEGVACPAP